ncbi:MAG TPA: hypothetical protein PLD88_13010, partial [Candidatus Berkiella sp.]|nr:hypothetical protein [Candidatus Berkiella sp.]
MWQPWKIWYHQLKGHYKSWYQSAAGLRTYQCNKINKLLEHTSCHIHFYQSYKGATLYDYPIIDKTFVQEHFSY